MNVLVLLILLAITLAIIGYNLAQRKHRLPALWAFTCISLGLAGILVLFCSRELDYNEELDFREESDTLGWFMFIISIIWAVVSSYSVILERQISIFEYSFLWR